MLPNSLIRELEEYFEENNVREKEREKIIKEMKKMYKKYLYSPEEPIGIITAQSLSEPATQMSIDFNEKVIIKRNGVIKIVKIGEFIDETMEKIGKNDVNGWDVCNISGKGILVPSLNTNEKIQWNEIKELSRHAAPKALLELKTRSGRKITATDSHSFVIRKNNKIVSVSGKSLKNGDRIPSLLFLPENCTQQLLIEPILQDQKHAKKKLPENLNLTKELGWIFGAYLAKGNTTDFYISFSNTDPVFLSKIRNFANSFGFTFNEYDNNRGFAPSHDIRVNSKQMSKLIKNMCSTGSKNKKVPEFAYSANEDFVSGLLSGYFDGDGNVSTERMVIRMSSSSEALIDGISLLLTRFGIFAKKGKGKEYTLSIPYKYANVFKEKIGFNIKSKVERLDKLCELFDKNKNKYHDFVDMISGFDDLLLNVCKKLKMPSRTINSFTKRQKIGRTVLGKYINIFENKSKEMGIDVGKEISILKSMYTSDVVWDEIVEISRVKPSSKYVYDFTVPETETFTTFDGIVTHNTMRTYHFAGTAGIQVTLGLPRMIEIFDARKVPKTPTMMVYIRPDFQEIEKVKKIAERIKEIKIKDIIKSSTVDMVELWVKCELSLSKMKKYDLDFKKLEKKVRVRDGEVSVDEKTRTMTVKLKKKEVSGLYKMKYNLFETHIAGIKGITQVVVKKNDSDEWIINTLGSNLKKVFDIEGVDTTRTRSNDIFEIYSVLGVEAARNSIINEATYTMEEQGLGIDSRYIMLLADLMTVKGDVKAIGRYGISGQKASVLVRAGFEETKKHFIEASVGGKTDELKGTIENIMMNQLATLGTGAFDLIGKIPDAKIKK